MKALLTAHGENVLSKPTEELPTWEESRGKVGETSLSA